MMEKDAFAISHIRSVPHAASHSLFKFLNGKAQAFARKNVCGKCLSLFPITIIPILRAVKF